MQIFPSKNEMKNMKNLKINMYEYIGAFDFEKKKSSLF